MGRKSSAARFLHMPAAPHASPCIDVYKRQVHVNAVKGGSQHMKGSAPVFRQRFIFFGSQGIDLPDHSPVSYTHLAAPYIIRRLRSAPKTTPWTCGGTSSARIRFPFPQSWRQIQIFPVQNERTHTGKKAVARTLFFPFLRRQAPVSYTQLDVYKRQEHHEQAHGGILSGFLPVRKASRQETGIKSCLSPLP